MFTLDQLINSGDTFTPQRFVIYGVQGIGKTVFGATFADPILLRTEDGAGAVNVPTFPQVAASYGDVCDAITALHGEHPFKTVVLDSLDWLEPLIWAEAVRTWNQANPDRTADSIEGPGYGKGYIEADKHWRTVMGGLDSLRLNKGMQIVVIAHSEIKTYVPPDSDPYDRYQIRIQKRAFALWQEWADNVLFINYKRRLVNAAAGPKPDARKRAEGNGERVICTQERPAYLAKNRWGLPQEIFIGQDVTWSAFHQAMNEATHGKYVNPLQTQQPQ